MQVVKVNVDVSPSSAERFAVRAIPTLVLFKDGREVERLLGAVEKTQIERRLASHIEANPEGEQKHGSAAL